MPEQQTAIHGYRELADHLRRQIEAGAFGPGQQLPTELEMSRQHGLNRHTVRSALQALEQEGYIHRVRGKGTFVSHRKILYAISQRTSFTTSLRRLGLEGCAEVLSAYAGTGPREAAEALALPADARLVVLEILRTIEGCPACFTTSYLPQRRFASLPEAAGQMESLYRLLGERYEVAGIHRAWSTIEAAAPAPRVRELLQLPAGVPILLTCSLAKDDHDRPVEYCVSHTRSDRVRLHVDLEHMP